MRPVRFAALLLVALACGGEGVEPFEKPPRNVVVITLDTTRADALGAYGQVLPATPRIDAMAAAGVLFEQALASTPSTLPSHATLFTGRLPFSHGVRSNSGYRLSDESTTLARRLQEHGFATRAEIAAPVLASDRGLAQGFDEYVEPTTSPVEVAEVLQEHAVMRLERSAEEITASGLEFLREHREGRFLLWLHYFDPHVPHRAPEPFASRFEDPYFAEVARTDRQVGLLLAELERLGLRQETLVVLTADHGEGRGEHGEETHAFYVYDSTMRVPLVFWGGGMPEGVRVGALVRLTDVAPTVLELLGLPPLPGSDGVSLVPLLRDPTVDPGLSAYGESIEFRRSFGGDVLRFVREGRFKYVHKLEPALYDVVLDPGETRNLAPERPELVERLRGRLEELLRAAPAAPGDTARVLSPEEVAQLQALGYAGDATGVDLGDEVESLELSGPDPDALEADLRVFISALAEVADGDPSDARPLFAWLFERHPTSRHALLGLIDVERKLGKEQEAVALLRRGMELHPEDAALPQQLGRILVKRGELGEAERLLRAALVLEPCLGQARLTLSQVLRRRGLQAERIAVLQELPESCGRNLVVDNALAFALATVPDPALRDGARATELAAAVVDATDREHPDYLDTLAAAYAEAGDFERAVAEQRQALALVKGRDLPPYLLRSIETNLAEFEAGRPLRRP